KSAGVSSTTCIRGSNTSSFPRAGVCKSASSLIFAFPRSRFPPIIGAANHFRSCFVIKGSHQSALGRGDIMRICRAARPWVLASAAVALVLAAVPGARAACCYFSAKNADILQPAQKVFITWDPEAKSETFTVQPKFEGNALDFGMVIPTPSQ